MLLGIYGSYVMSTLPPAGGNINGKLTEEEAILRVRKWWGLRTALCGL